MLDYKSTAQDTGKPTSVDLHLGLATAPVLFAAQQVRIRQVISNFSAKKDAHEAILCE